MLLNITGGSSNPRKLYIDIRIGMKRNMTMTSVNMDNYRRDLFVKFLLRDHKFQSNFDGIIWAAEIKPVVRT